MIDPAICAIMERSARSLSAWLGDSPSGGEAEVDFMTLDVEFLHTPLSRAHAGTARHDLDQTLFADTPRAVVDGRPWTATPRILVSVQRPTGPRFAIAPQGDIDRTASLIQILPDALSTAPSRIGLDRNDTAHQKAARLRRFPAADRDIRALIKALEVIRAERAVHDIAAAIDVSPDQNVSWGYLSLDRIRFHKADTDEETGARKQDARGFTRDMASRALRAIASHALKKPKPMRIVRPIAVSRVYALAADTEQSLYDFLLPLDEIFAYDTSDAVQKIALAKKFVLRAPA